MSKEAPSAAEVFQANVTQKLQTLNDRQDSIQTMSLWVIHHKTHCTLVSSAWIAALKKAVPAKKRLTLFYLVNDVLQNCKRKNAKIYLLAFKPVLKEAVAYVRNPEIRPKIERILKIWEERAVYVQEFVNELKDILAKSDEATDSITDQIIDDFKPSELSAAITEFKRYEGEVAAKHGQLVQVHLDASSVEAIKALKDRNQSKQFAMEFEESCVKMEDYVAALDKEMKERAKLLEQLEQAQLFYDAQSNESQVVVKAYKNFGIRVKNVKKRLDERMESGGTGADSSPVSLSLPTDAPSPGNTPPLDPSQDNVESIDMDLSDEESDAVPGGIVGSSPVKAKASDAIANKPGSQAGDRLSSVTGLATRIATPVLPGTATTAVTAAAAAAAAAAPKAVYDPRQAYNPAYHMQPKASVATVPVNPISLIEQNVLQMHQTKPVQPNKVIATVDASTPTPTGVPAPVQLPASATTSVTSSAITPSQGTPAAGPASSMNPNLGIQLLSKLINQAGSSPSQSPSSVLESLTSFAQTVKALTAAKKEESTGVTPATWSDWKKKQMERDDDGAAAKGSSSSSAALVQPRRPVPPPDLAPAAVQLAAGGHSTFAGAFMPMTTAMMTPAPGGAKVGITPMSVVPLAPPPPLPALLTNRMGSIASASGPSGIAASLPPLPTTLPPPLPPLPPSGMRGPFDQPMMPMFPFDRPPPPPPFEPELEGSCAAVTRQPQQNVTPPAPGLEMPSSRRPVVAQTTSPEVANPRPPPPLQKQSSLGFAAPAVQAVLAKLGSALPLGTGLHSSTESGSGLLSLLPGLTMPTATQTAPSAYLAQTMPLACAAQGCSTKPAEEHAAGVSSTTVVSSGVTTPTATLPAAIMAVLNSGLSKSKETPPAKPSLEAPIADGTSGSAVSAIVGARSSGVDSVTTGETLDSSDSTSCARPACASQSEQKLDDLKPVPVQASAEIDRPPVGDEEFYPIQSLASIRKPDHFDRRGGSSHSRRDQRRGVPFTNEPFPPDMADYYHHFGGDHYHGGDAAGNRSHEHASSAQRKSHDHGHNSMPYSFHPY